jgi:uncharacterized integral membrane protein
MPWWGWLVIALLSAALVGLVIVLLVFWVRLAKSLRW